MIDVPMWPYADGHQVVAERLLKVKQVRRLIQPVTIRMYLAQDNFSDNQRGFQRIPFSLRKPFD